MRKRIIALVVWVILTVAYVWTIGDTGRSMGAQAKDAYESYVEYYTGEYIGVEGFAEGITDAWSYSYFNDLEQEFKSNMLAVSIETVVYIALTLTCYHIVFRKNKENSTNITSKD